MQVMLTFQLEEVTVSYWVKFSFSVLVTVAELIPSYEHPNRSINRLQSRSLETLFQLPHLRGRILLTLSGSLSEDNLVLVCYILTLSEFLL